MDRVYKIFPSPHLLAETFAQEFVNMVLKTAKKQKQFTAALSGGNTPNLFFGILADKYSKSIDWSMVHFFWADERCVPPDDPESNYGMAYRIFLSKINIPEKNIHRIKGEDNPVIEAYRYSEEIGRFTALNGGFPGFNTIILGVGDDGHTASIFPGNNHLMESGKTCEVAVHPVSGQKRITLTGKVINNADIIFFLVTGESKAIIVNQIFGEKAVSADIPASRIVPVNGKTEWWIDINAGALIR